MSQTQSLMKFLSNCGQSTYMPPRERLVAALAGFLAIFLLVTEIHFLAPGMSFKLLALASMGASTCLIFAVPHSPLAQPWPVLGGHLVSSVMGVACAQWIPDPALATAVAVALALLAMSTLRCLHPPSAATALFAILGGPSIHALGWHFCAAAAINAGTLVTLGLIINNLIPGRRYPQAHAHHPHHAKFVGTAHPSFVSLNEEDFKYALRQMDGVIAVSEEDLVDLYEFALEHAQAKNKA